MLTLDGLLLALGIFVLRIINSAIGTLRVVFITKQMKLLAAILAFIEAWVFAVVMSSVVSDLSNMPNLIAYCGGFSVGNYIAMWIEGRFMTSYMAVNIIARERGHELAAALRSKGYGVTETHGEGREGTVITLRSVVTHRDVSKLVSCAYEIVPDAFVSVTEIKTVQHGWISAPRVGHR
ncbi:MAG: DUF5698 domain-containing protein [Anaerolineae bacterium]